MKMLLLALLCALTYAQTEANVNYVTCSWVDLEVNDIDSWPHIGYSCAEGKVIVGMDLNKAKDPIRIRCCSLVGHSAIISESCRYQPDVTKNEEKHNHVQCGEDEVLAGLYHATTPDYLEDGRKVFDSLERGRCCKIECQLDYCPPGKFGIDETSCAISETKTGVNECGKNQLLKGVIDAKADNAASLLQFTEIECCDLDNVSPPSISPTEIPSEPPSEMPSFAPTSAPSEYPSFSPTSAPSEAPSEMPSFSPTSSPSDIPSFYPTATAPSQIPSDFPSAIPTESPTSIPTTSPTTGPSLKPTSMPSDIPSRSPSSSPTESPSSNPSIAPTTSPSSEPTAAEIQSIQEEDIEYMFDEMMAFDGYDIEAMYDTESSEDQTIAGLSVSSDLISRHMTRPIVLIIIFCSFAFLFCLYHIYRRAKSFREESQGIQANSLSAPLITDDFSRAAVNVHEDDPMTDI